MKKKLLATILCGLVIFGLSACGGNSADSNESTKKAEEKVYIEDSQIDELFTSPENFKGKYVKLSGNIFTSPEKDGDTTALQVWHDVKNASQNFIVYTDSSDSFAQEDYVIIDGKIDGEFSGENALGQEVTVPLIIADSITKSSYIDVVAPTVKEITPDVTAEQHDLSATVDKIEYSDIETRVYITLDNKSDENAGADVYGAKIIQDGKQISQDQSSTSIYDGNYEQLDYEISAGASSSGILVFPVMDQSKDFQIVIPNIYSDNYELQFEDFKLDVKAE